MSKLSAGQSPHAKCCDCCPVARAVLMCDERKLRREILNTKVSHFLDGCSAPTFHSPPDNRSIAHRRALSVWNTGSGDGSSLCILDWGTSPSALGTYIRFSKNVKAAGTGNLLRDAGRSPCLYVRHSFTCCYSLMFLKPCKQGKHSAWGLLFCQQSASGGSFFLKCANGLFRDGHALCGGKFFGTRLPAHRGELRNGEFGHAASIAHLQASYAITSSMNSL